MAIQIRKVQKVGGSFLATLPHLWVKEHNIGKEIRFLVNGFLILLPPIYDDLSEPKLEELEKELNFLSKKFEPIDLEYATIEEFKENHPDIYRDLKRDMSWLVE